MEDDVELEMDCDCREDSDEHDPGAYEYLCRGCGVTVAAEDSAWCDDC